MIKLKVNGVSRQFDGDPDMPLLWYLRDDISLTGTKFSCGMGLCGSCTVHINGAPARACVTPMKSMEGKAVLTIEGLSAKGDHPVQKAWKTCAVAQCGYCQPGQIMQAAGLLNQNKKPSDAQINEMMAGNICRCGCYQRIFAAVKTASQEA